MGAIVENKGRNVTGMRFGNTGSDEGSMMEVYEQVFGKREDLDDSLNGDDIKKVRDDLERKNKDRHRMQVVKDDKMVDDESETEYENDTDNEVQKPVSLFTKRKQLIKFGSKHLRSYREMVNDTTDSSQETSPVKPELKCSDKPKQQMSAIRDIHQQILKDKRRGVVKTDKSIQNLVDDTVKVEENELDNALNVRLETLLEMKRKERLHSQTSDSNYSNTSDQLDKSLKENNSDVVEESPNKLNSRLKKLLQNRKLATNFDDGVVKNIRIREREITFKEKSQPPDSETFAERTYAVTQTEVTYNYKNAPTKTFVDDFEMKCSIREFENAVSKENFAPKSSMLSKKLSLFKKSSLELDKT